MAVNYQKTESSTAKDLQLYTADEVAKLLRVKKPYVYELIYSGRLKSIRLSERRIRIPESSILDFIKKESGWAGAN
jgi:excisionase family DNA binding protein